MERALQPSLRKRFDVAHAAEFSPNQNIFLSVSTFLYRTELIIFLETLKEP